jgi:hypothetical protein
MIFYEEGQIVPVGEPVIKLLNTNAVKAKLYVPEIDLAAIERAAGCRYISSLS